MGFSVGRYAKVWKIEDKGNYAVCNLSVGRRDSETKVYVNDFKDGYVSFVGSAYNKIKGMTVEDKKGITVIIKSCDVSNIYTSPEGKVSFKAHYTVFDIDFPNNGGNNGDSNKKEDAGNTVEDFVNAGSNSDEEELPF